MRILFLASLLLAGCTTTVMVQEFRPNAGLVQVSKAMDSSVLIACLDKDGTLICRGSGVIVGPRTVVTARHLFSREKPHEVIVQTALAKDSAKGEILRMGDDDEDDWAVLKISKYLGPSSESPKEYGGRLWRGERCVVIGYALGFIEPTITDGRYCGMEDHPNFYRISADTVFGNSGGGVYVWRSGQLKLIGVMSRLAVAKGSAVYHMAWATRIERVK